VSSLPEAVGNAQVYGETTEFGGRVPVCGMAGDQQAALYGQGCHSPGLGKNTYGTGNFLLQHAGAGSPLLEQGLITTIAWGIGDRLDYALESSMFVTGAGVQWLRDGLGIIARADETEALAASLDGNDGVYFVPALTGLGSPHWDPYARGTIVGYSVSSGGAQTACTEGSGDRSGARRPAIPCRAAERRRQGASRLRSGSYTRRSVTCAMRRPERLPATSSARSSTR
jgi:glycerol kinase